MNMNWFKEKLVDLLDSAYITALLELISTYVFSNTPFIALVIYEIFSRQDAKFDTGSIYCILASNIISGEIFIYIATLVAPGIYLMIKYNRARRHFYAFPFFFYGQFVIIFLCLIFFVMNRSDKIENISLINNWSLTLYIFSILYWYASLVFSRKLESPPRRGRTGSENILSELNK